MKRGLCLGFVWIFLPLVVRAAVINQYGGSYGNWPSVWTALGLNDGDDGLNEYVDIVGDATDPAVQWARDNAYIYFRVRLDTGTFDSTATAARNTWLVMIDAQSYVHPSGATNRPDYAFMFDLKGEQSQPGHHGLEMGEIDVTGTKWSDQRFDDIDNNASTKIAPPDFATSGGDGYLRTTDGVTTANFGTTTFMDFAIRSAYLGSQASNLWASAQWRIQVASIENATDHNKLSGDVAGGQGVGSTITVGSWSEIITAIPEPSGVGVAFVLLVGLGVRRRIRGGANRLLTSAATNHSA